MRVVDWLFFDLDVLALVANYGHILICWATGHELGVERRPINVTDGVRVGGAQCNPMVNTFGSPLEDWLRCFWGVATKHLDGYIDSYRILNRSVAMALPVWLLILVVWG